MLTIDLFDTTDLRQILLLTTNISKLGIWVWNIETNTVCGNLYSYELFGFDTNICPLEKDDFFKRIHPEDISKVEEGCNQLLTGVHPITIEYRIFRPLQKDIKIIRTINDVSCDEHGSIKKIRCICLDITELESNKTEITNYTYKLERALYSIINTLSLITNIRDPYTAGHEERVSLLSVEIAKHMDFTEWQIQGIAIGAQIHDLGKIWLCSDILCRPGKLTPILWELIKMHPFVGYTIMKEVELPWNISNIIIQHHERLDGSGYPYQLKDEQIDIETKIISVADVVEAMSSHRPYRPALGIDSALEEISKNKGKLYCPDVVDVCIDLFTKYNFKLPTSNKPIDF